MNIQSIRKARIIGALAGVGAVAAAGGGLLFTAGSASAAGNGTSFTSQISSPTGQVGTPFSDNFIVGAGGCPSGTPASGGGCEAPPTINYQVLGPVAAVNGVCPPQDVLTSGTESGAYANAPVASSGALIIPPGTGPSTTPTPPFTPVAAGCYTYRYDALAQFTQLTGPNGAPTETILVSAMAPTTAPVTTTTVPSPATTVPSPATTVPSPATTVPSPATTTPAPTTTVPAPTTTSPAPVTTTSPAPVTTSPAPVVNQAPAPVVSQARLPVTG